MNGIQHEESAKRNPFAALILSMAATGLGHVYCGRLTKGLVLFFISFAFSPIIITGIQSISSTFSLITVILSVLILIGVFVYAAIDAFITARKTPSPYQLREFNRWYIYLLFIVVSLTYPTNVSSNIRSDLVQAFKIPSASMVPTILKGDYVFLNKAVYRMQAPKRGDMVIFVNPNDRRKNWIKRIVALPNDTVEIRNNVLLINDEPLVYRPVSKNEVLQIKNQITGSVMEEINGSTRYSIMITNGDGANFKKTTVPNGHCFVLGDNRGNSTDSRQLGPIPLRDVMGRVDFIYFPAETWSRFGRLENGMDQLAK